MSELSEESQSLVRAILEGTGMVVNRIPESKARTADFLVTDGRQRYLVEVTNREPARDYRDFLNRLRRDGASTLVRGIGRQNRLDSAVVEKAGQLRETPVEAAFRIVWLTGLHSDDEHMMEELFLTLYGIARLQVFRNPRDPAEWNPPRTVDCYYYDLFSLRLESALHAVGFASVDRTALFLNPFADDADSFRRSGLASAFANIARLVDPEDDATKRDALHIPPDVERTPQALHKALREKYGLFSQRPTESDFSSRVVIPFKK